MINLPQKSISVFIPVYNENSIIDHTIQSILETMQSITEDYEILVIDDGSTDGSAEKVLKWVGRNNKIRLIRHAVNQGYGTALRTGFGNASKDIIFYTDADMPVHFEEVKEVIHFLEYYDLVIGYRINREDTLRRFIYSKVYNLLLWLLFQVKVRDANFSFKFIRREALSKCSLKSTSVFIDGELLAEAVRNNFTIKEVPIIYRPRRFGRSNFDTLDAAFLTMREILAYFKNRFSKSIVKDAKKFSG